MAEIPELKSQAEDSSTTQQTPWELREELFLEEQDLLDSMDPEFSSALQDEFDEMKEGYTKEINKQKEASEWGMLSLESWMGIQNKVLKLKNDFAEDYEWINKIDELSNLDNYEEFKNLILENALWNRIEEKLFGVLSDFDITQVQRAIWNSLPVDKTGVKLMMKNVKNNIDVTVEDTNVQENAEQKELKEKQKLLQLEEKTAANSEITELLNNDELINIEDISQKINDYKEEYWEDNFSRKISFKLAIMWDNRNLTDKNQETRNSQKLMNTIDGIFTKVWRQYPLKNLHTALIFLEKGNVKLAIKEIESIPQAELEQLFNNLKKRVDSEIVEKGIDVKTEKWQEELKKLDSYKDYVSIHNNLSGVSDSMLQKVYNTVWKPEDLYVNYLEEGNNHIAVTSQEQWLLKASGFDFDKSKTTWNIIYQSWKEWFWKGADLSKIPPETYLMSEKTGFKLAIDLPKIPEELIYERKKLAKNLSINNKQISKLSTSLEARNRDLENKKNNWEDLTELKSKIDDLESKIQDLHEMNEEFNENFIKILDIYKVQAEAEYQLKEKQRLETMKFIARIGFDVVPQHLTTQMIDTINGVGHQAYWFDAPIDLENGDLWMRMDWENDLMWLQLQKRFMNNFIKAIWSPKNIFLEGNISNNWMVVDPAKLKTYLNENKYMWLTWSTMMLNNLKQWDIETDTNEI